MKARRFIPFLAMTLSAAAAPDAPLPGLPLRLVADVPMSGRTSRLDYQSLDSKNHLLFIAHLGDSLVSVFNVETGKFVADIPDVAKVHGVLAVPELGRVYASATGTDEVVAIDPRTLKVTARMPGGVYPDGMGFAPGTGKLYVSDENGRTETVIDTATNKRVATIELGGGVGNTQYDPLFKRILVNVHTGELVAIDPVTDKVVARAKLEGADGNHGLLVDAERGLAYVACEGNDRLLVVDLKTLKVTQSFTLGEGPDVLAFDPGLKRLYVASESGVISIFDAGEKGLAKVGEGMVAPHAHTVAVDPATHRVYFPIKDVNGKPVLRVMEPSA